MWESHLCAPEALFFLTPPVKLHHGEEWRWERPYAWVAGAGSTGFQSGIQNESCVRPRPSLFLYPSPWRIWIVGHNHKQRRSSNLWISESTKSGFLWHCSPLSYSPKLMSIINHSPVALILQDLFFSSSPPPSLAVSHASLKPVSSTLAPPPSVLSALVETLSGSEFIGGAEAVRLHGMFSAILH